jgi:hypothetical protein
VYELIARTRARPISNEVICPGFRSAVPVATGVGP